MVMRLHYLFKMKVRATDPVVAVEVWSGQFGRLPPGVDVDELAAGQRPAIQ